MNLEEKTDIIALVQGYKLRSGDVKSFEGLVGNHDWNVLT